MRLNGCRERRLRTVVGEIRPRTPRHREGGYFPDEVLRPYPRTDRAMVGAIAKVYKLGLSTRKIERAAAYVHTMPRINCPPAFPVPPRAAAL